MFNIEPINNVELIVARNAGKIKSAMEGSEIWISLTSEYQLEILSNKDHFKRQGEFDLPSIWRHICDHVNPSTTIRSANLKDKLGIKN